MAEQQEFYSSESPQTLDSVTGQQQSSTVSSSVGFGGGGFGSQRFGLGQAMNHVGGNNLFGGSTAGFRIGGFLPGNTVNTTSVFGRNISGFSMTLDGNNLRIDLTSPGSFGRSSDNVFVRYSADSDGPSGSAGSPFDTSHSDPIGFSGFQHPPPATAQGGATTIQVPQTEDFQAHIESVGTKSDRGTAGLASLPSFPPAAPDGAPAQVPLTEHHQEHTIIEHGFTLTDHYHAITSSTPFMNFSFEELRLIDYRQRRQQNALPDHSFTTNSNISDIPFPKSPSIAFTGNKNSVVTSSPTSPTPASGSGGVDTRAFSHPPFALGHQKLPPPRSGAFRFGNLPPPTSGAFRFGNLPSSTLRTVVAGSQGTFNHPFQAYTEQDPSHQYCYQTLGFLNPYKTSSFEELRLIDYIHGSVRYPGAEQLKLDTIFGKPITPSGSGNQSFGTASPFSAEQISSSGNSRTDQPRRFTEAIPSGGRSFETTNPVHEAASLSREGTNEANPPNIDTPFPELPGPLSEASEETKPSLTCSQQ